jgi:hypothetical protein
MTAAPVRAAQDFRMRVAQPWTPAAEKPDTPAVAVAAPINEAETLILFPVTPLPPEPKLAPDTKPAPDYPTHAECRAELMEIAKGIEIVGGKVQARNKRQVAMDMFLTTFSHLKARGKFLRITSGPYYLDDADKQLIKLSKDSPNFKHLLLCLDYLPKHGYTTSILEAIMDCAARAEVRHHHRVAFFGADAIYIRSAENQMLKITQDYIQEVPVGADDVILIAPDMAAWPPLKELEPLMDEMRGQVGKACTQLLPDLPLTKHLTTRWSTDSILSPTQAHSLFIQRLLFVFAASRYSLWPITLLVGDQNSGKSTPLELMLVLLKDDPKAEAKALPGREDGIIAALTNSAICCFDNIDGARLDDPQRSTISDTLCHIATGAEVPWRKLHSDMEILHFKIQNHGCFTARTNPFAHRSDVLRRTQTFTMAPPDPANTIPKDLLKKQIHEARPRILAEILLRCQNMVRAHLKLGEKQYRGVSEMLDYEVFCYRCAEFEGALPETQALWKANHKQYLESITEHNFLILAIRIWLGRKGNVGREVSPLTLFGELHALFAETRNFPYRNPGQFGVHIKKNLSALVGVLGFDKPPTKSNHNYVFRPSEEEQKQCRQQYLDFDATDPFTLRMKQGEDQQDGDRYPMDGIESMDGIEPTRRMPDRSVM